jgi:hypothetical protein
MAVNKHSPGCGCCGEPPPYESCINETYSLTNGTAFDTAVWEADDPGNVSYVASEQIQVTDTIIRLLSPTVKTAYAVRVSFSGTSGTVKIQSQADILTAASSGSASVATVAACMMAVNGGTSEQYSYDPVSNAARLQVNFTPDHIQVAASAYTNGDEATGVDYIACHVLLDSTTPRNYNENWEIEVTGTVTITEVYYQTATVDYTTTPQTYCDPEELWEDEAMYPYQYMQLYSLVDGNNGQTEFTDGFTTTGTEIDDLIGGVPYGYYRWGNNGIPYYAFLHDLATAPPDILSFFTGTGHFVNYRCGVDTFNTTPNSNDAYRYYANTGVTANGFMQYRKDNPSNGDEYPIPEARITFRFKTDCMFTPAEVTSDIPIGDVGEPFSISNGPRSINTFACSGSMTLQWDHG